MQVQEFLYNWQLRFQLMQYREILLNEVRKPHSFRNPEICKNNFNLYKVMDNNYRRTSQLYLTNSQTRITD